MATKAGAVRCSPPNGVRCKDNLWIQQIPLLVRALAVCKNTLLIAGPPDLLDPNGDASPEDMIKQEAAFNGDSGAKLWVLDCATGQMKDEYEIEAPPVWDGMAAAGGRLFVSLKNGTVVCLGR